MKLTPEALSRREFIIGVSAAAAAVLAVAKSDPALATPEAAAAEIKKFAGERPMTRGRIKLDLPSIAENGLVVPLNFEVASPMTEADHVKTLRFFAEGNPYPQIADFMFTPMMPKAAGQFRIRLAQSQSIVAVAEMSDGRLYTERAEIKVTIGGCGG